MKTIIIALLFVSGCAHSVDENNTTVDDAGDETVSDASSQPLCCQVDQDIVDGQFWQNGLYSCSPSEPPWVCGQNMSCGDPGCRVGYECHGFNGTGFVQACADY